MAQQQKRRKKSKKAAVELPLFVVILLIVLAVIAYILYTRGFFDKWLKKQDVITDELQIHFLETGNRYSGDCILIKSGDTEVLVDAGSRQSSAETIVSYVNNYCTDGILEYVIVTHADQDHIAGFVGTASAPGIFDAYECKTVIDFAKTDKTTALYQKYLDKRDAEVAAGAVHYTALDCYNNAGGAKRSYELAPDITLNFLYQRYYEESSSDENNYSVCFLLSQGNNHYLFTGDLEEAGEESLVERNDLPKCKLFKAGHHGSPTSSTDKLLSVIQPEIVCVTCCCGATEYTSNIANVFPSQAFCNRVKAYTDKIYVTTIYSETAEGNHAALNGNIVISSDGGEVKVTCSGSAEPFTQSEWYNTYRKNAA
ncbi:MAG: ComEC/Rec2 family competence protein [Candidatus Scatosoma sp.]